MVCQIQSDYAHPDERLPKDHIYEAMRCIRHRYILEMGDEIELIPEKEPWQEEKQGQQRSRELEAQGFKGKRAK